MKTVKQPSFFIVGAPKCGTTAMCRYLTQHPQLFIPPEKELYYFDFDFQKKPKIKSLEEYLSKFELGKDKICGEGSTSYLRSQQAPKAIYDFNPDAKIIIMLREPVSLLYSLHSQRLYDGNEEIEDFQQALEVELDPNYKTLKQFPNEYRNPEFLIYREVMKFTEQIERYFNLFGKERVFVIFYEDFNKNTSKVFQDVLSFLGVRPDFEPEFVRVNSNKTVKSRFLLNLVKYPPAKLLEMGKYLIPLPQKTRRAILEGVKEKIKSANTQFKPRPSLDVELRKTLQKEFAPERERLSQLLGRDLTHWGQN